MAAFDRVMSGILYNAIFESEKTLRYNRALLETSVNVFADLAEAHEGLENIVYAYDVSGLDLELCNDMGSERIICYKKV